MVHVVVLKKKSPKIRGCMRFEVIKNCGKMQFEGYTFILWFTLLWNLENHISKHYSSSGKPLYLEASKSFWASVCFIKS